MCQLYFYEACLAHNIHDSTFSKNKILALDSTYFLFYYVVCGTRTRTAKKKSGRVSLQEEPNERCIYEKLFASMFEESFYNEIKK